MPEWLHKQLSKSAKKRGLKGNRYKAYVYGTMKKIEKGVKGKHRARALSKHS